MSHRDKFAELVAKDYSRQAEQKGKFSYLPWSISLAAARVAYDKVTVQYSPVEIIEGVVGVTVRVLIEAHLGDEFTRMEVPLAVTDHTNKAIPRPNVKDIENTRQRALAKAIACLTGIGLSMWDKDVQGLGEAAQIPDPKQSKEVLRELWRTVQSTAGEGEKVDVYMYLTETLGRTVTKDTVAYLEDDEVAAVLKEIDARPMPRESK